MITVSINENDYVLAMVKDGKKSKKFLAKITDCESGPTGGMFEALMVNHVKGIEEPVTLSRNEIIANMGSTPVSGTSYGVKVEAAGDVHITPAGNLTVYKAVEEGEVEDYLKSINAIFARFQHYGLDTLFPIDFQLLKSSGSAQGRYIRRKGGNRIDAIQFELKDEEYELGGPSMIRRVLYHELGHGIEFHLMTDDHRTRWMELHNNYINNKFASQDKLDEFKEIMKNTGKLPNETEDDANLTKHIYGYISSYHCIGRKDLTLIYEMNPEMLDSIWPTELELFQQEDVISDYAGKNWKEFWCESISIGMKDGAKTLPDKVASEYLATMKELTNGRYGTKPNKASNDSNGEVPNAPANDSAPAESPDAANAESSDESPSDESPSDESANAVNNDE